MKILVINCGSSSLKYQLLDMDTNELMCKGQVERIGIQGSLLTHKISGRDDFTWDMSIENHEVAVELVLKTLTDPEHGVIESIDEIDGVGHRVVHGGPVFAQPVLITEEVKKVIDEFSDLAPLHNPANLIGIEACEKAMPMKPMVAVFDTAFGLSMIPRAYMYGLPEEYYEKYHIRRYGFHGTSHEYVAQRTIEFGHLDPEKARVIVCHLGNGASVSASIGGKCVDTSMGLTPDEGLIMGTRSGDVDPGVIQYLCHKLNVDIDGMMEILNKKSGLLGLSGGVSSDFRDLEAASHAGNLKARNALKTFRYRVAKYIGSYIPPMKGVDAISFTAGVGENIPYTRYKICTYLEYLGIDIDEGRNKVRGKEAMISRDLSPVKVFVIPTNEELKIAQHTVEIIKGTVGD